MWFILSFVGNFQVISRQKESNDIFSVHICNNNTGQYNNYSFILYSLVGLKCIMPK
jgi:hypothetical protein